MARYGSSTFATSLLYPVVAVEMLAGVQPLPIHAPFYSNGVPDQFAATASLLSGTIATSLLSYTNGLPEQIQGTSATLVSGTITLGLLSYTNGLAEQIQGNSAVPVSGTITLGLLSYTNWPTEAIQGSASWTSGTIT